MLPVMMEEEEGSASEGTDSERFSGSIASFLANEKLMSLDSMNSDMTGRLRFFNLFFIIIICSKRISSKEEPR